MIADRNLELASTWDQHVGPDIGGVIPTAYGWRDHPLSPTIREFYIKDPAWGNWLAACHRPVCPNTGQLKLVFDLYVDSSAAAVAQAIEFDTKLAIGGYMYDFSSQFNYQTGTWQISGPTSGWKETGWRPGRFQSGKLYQVGFMYSFDVTNNKFSFIEAFAGGNFYLLPAQFQGMAATKTDWVDSCNLQVQQDLAGKGGAFSIYMRNIEYQWT